MSDPVAVGLVALNAAAGNQAVVGLLRDQRLRAASPERGFPVQRRINERRSDRDLVTEYRTLLREKEFADMDAELDRVYRRPVTLRWNPDPSDPGAIYDTNAHVIYIPVNSSPAKQRDLILFEMHNALTRKEIARQTRSHVTESARLADASVRTQYIDPYASVRNAARARAHTAAYALAAEWSEWVSTAEGHIRASRINNRNPVDAAGQPLIQDRHMSSFSGAASFYSFRNYLETQRSGLHTFTYDTASASPYWVGMTMLADVENRSWGAVNISPQELSTFGRRLSGTNRRELPQLKVQSRNPFTDNGVVHRFTGTVDVNVANEVQLQSIGLDRVTAAVITRLRVEPDHGPFRSTREILDLATVRSFDPATKAWVASHIGVSDDTIRGVQASIAAVRNSRRARAGGRGQQAAGPSRRR